MMTASIDAAELHVLSAGSTLHGLRPCAAAFSRIAIPVSVATDHAHNIQKAAFHGRVDVDVILLPTDMITALIASGHVAAEPVVECGCVRIGGAVPATAAMPDISTMDNLSNALIAAGTVLLTHAPTGDHLLTVIERLGLTDVVARKLQRFDTATLLAAHLATAAADTIGFAPETEIRGWQHANPDDGHITWAGPVPEEIQVALPYGAAMMVTSHLPETARAFLSFLATAEARKYFSRSGVT